jgi:WD40 repeat protein
MFGMSKRDKGAGTRLSRLWQADLGDHVIGLAWHPGGGALAAAAVSGPVKVYDPVSGGLTHDLPGHGFGTTAVAWSGDGAHLASAGQDGEAKLWDLAADKVKVALSGGAAWVERLAWCPGDAGILATAAGKKLRLWAADGTLIGAYPDHPGTITDLAWRPRFKLLASAAYGRLALWLPGKADPAQVFEWKGGAMLALAWSPNGEFIATGNQDSTVRVWMVKTGEDLEMSGYPLKVRELAWDSSSKWLATGGGHLPCVWDCSGKGPAGRKPMQCEAHTDKVTALAFQHVAPVLASAGADGLIALWAPGQQQAALCQERLPAEVSQIAWSPDDRFLAAGTAAGTVAVFRCG